MLSQNLVWFLQTSLMRMFLLLAVRRRSPAVPQAARPAAAAASAARRLPTTGAQQARQTQGRKQLQQVVRRRTRHRRQQRSGRKQMRRPLLACKPSSMPPGEHGYCHNAACHNTAVTSHAAGMQNCTAALEPSELESGSLFCVATSAPECEGDRHTCMDASALRPVLMRIRPEGGAGQCSCAGLSIAQTVEALLPWPLQRPSFLSLLSPHLLLTLGTLTSTQLASRTLPLLLNREERDAVDILWRALPLPPRTNRHSIQVPSN